MDKRQRMSGNNNTSDATAPDLESLEKRAQDWKKYCAVVKSYRGEENIPAEEAYNTWIEIAGLFVAYWEDDGEYWEDAEENPIVSEFLEVMGIVNDLGLANDAEELHPNIKECIFILYRIIKKTEKERDESVKRMEEARRGKARMQEAHAQCEEEQAQAKEKIRRLKAEIRALRNEPDRAAE